LNWNEIRELASDPLATIGCHTINHLPLAKLDELDVEREILFSKKELEEELNCSVKHFAFPFGSTNEASSREYRIAKAAGFDSIVTTLHGHIRLGDDPWCLDRIFLSPLHGASLATREVFWNIKSAATTIRRIF